jgi:hypothetical protein
VLFVGSEANIQKNTLEVKVALDEPAAVFKPEMLVDVTYLAPKPAETTATAEAKTRLYVPQQLVQQSDGASYVWAADQSSGRARKIPVTQGAAAPAGLVEVTGGLAAGSRIISRGYESLDDGDRIKVVSEDASVAATAAADPTAHKPLHRLPQGE